MPNHLDAHLEEAPSLIAVFWPASEQPLGKAGPDGWFGRGQWNDARAINAG
jgi:hypothetical protein